MRAGRVAGVHRSTMGAVSDVAIQATNLKKVYRLYARPTYRFLDMFGLLKARPGAFTEHTALDGINLEIRRGEKVAIIGRNGAGKSTFLKLVTNVIQPTSGSLRVVGDVHALLQIGTGFHPDFTGRENVRAYLAQLGLSGAEATRRCADAIAFAELEEYIDQPVKVYSTGMAMRLMFAASTAITPDLLVLDEVLGVGDAYFAQKSYERMRELCDRNGSTLLLVTHDIYSATRMCERVVWLEHGNVAMDGAGAEVVEAYAQSIRAQEEHRLRLKKQAQLAAAGMPDDGTVDGAPPLLLEIQASPSRVQPCAVYFSGIALIRDGHVVAELPLGDPAAAASQPAHVVEEGSSWGTPIEWQGRMARPMLHYGSPFHKVVAAFQLSRELVSDGSSLTLRLDYWSEESCDLRVRCYRGALVEDLGTVSTVAGEWGVHTASYTPSLTAHTSDALIPSEAPFLQGSGAIVISGFSMIDGDGLPTHTVRHGEEITFRIHYQIRKKGLREKAQVFIVVSRNNIERVCKFMTDRLCFDEERAATGVVEMRLPKMMLGAGQFSIAVQIAAEGYIEQESNKFFSVDPDVYHCIMYAMDFTVIDAGWIGNGTIFEGEGDWTMKPATPHLEHDRG
jgi:homopolymeric O-antigen transport system ATP-binding protein